MSLVLHRHKDLAKATYTHGSILTVVAPEAPLEIQEQLGEPWDLEQLACRRRAGGLALHCPAALDGVAISGITSTPQVNRRSKAWAGDGDGAPG